MKRFTKLFNTKATSVDESAKTIKFKISDNQPDRMGEVVDQGTWNVKDYLTNPILLWGHDSSQPENVLGSTLAIETEGDSTYATVRLDEDINPKAGLVWKQLLRGTLRTVSVGFINHTFEMDKDTPVLKDNELLEISVVPIPANPRAIALSLQEGSISRKDAKWLVDSMKAEAELVEAQMKATDDKSTKEKTMDKEQAQALIDGIAKLTEKVEAQAEQITELKERVPAPETEEEKTAREAKEAEDKKAAEDEAARKAEEDANKPPAKDGDDDQSGAGDGDTFDPDAELTPELQAEIDATLAEEREAVAA